MKIKTILGFFALMSVMSLAAAQGETAATNEARQVRYAEDIIMIELTRALSDVVRAAREQCHPTAYLCTGEYSELAIGLLGIGRGDVAADALVNLLGLRLDGGDAEELICQIFIRGHTLENRLARWHAKSIAQHCQSLFYNLQKRELRNIPDVKVEQVCHSEAEIRQAQDEMLKAVKSNTACDL